MTIQLRQICLVAEKLEPVIEGLCDVLGLKRAYVDPAVAVFGLENTLLPVGRNFLEVVAPIRQDTAGGRYLARRGGDGGYMVITQADTRPNQLAVRQQAQDLGVRVAYERSGEDWSLIQLHPGDMRAAFLEIEWDRSGDIAGNWMPAGGGGWEDKVRQDVTLDFVGVELQGPDPVALGSHWAEVLGLALDRDGAELSIQLNNARLRFVEATDGRGPGLGGLDIAVADRQHILSHAKARGAYVSEDQVNLCGTRFYLV